MNKIDKVLTTNLERARTASLPPRVAEMEKPLPDVEQSREKRIFGRYEDYSRGRVIERSSGSWLGADKNTFVDCQRRVTCNDTCKQWTDRRSTWLVWQGLARKKWRTREKGKKTNRQTEREKGRKIGKDRGRKKKLKKEEENELKRIELRFEVGSERPNRERRTHELQQRDLIGKVHRTAR